MPQLDKVTLFSQVFWLLFLYFSFFLVLLKYFLPTFSKLFKVRSYFLNEQKNVTISFSSKLDGSQILNLLSKFETQLKINLELCQKYTQSELQSYNFIHLKDLNKLFISLYIKSCLSSFLYKKLYI
jgi:hypothetical protein